MTQENNTCCWFNSCLSLEKNPLEIEELCDDNDTDIIFINESENDSTNNEINKNIFPKTPISFFCNSYRFGNKRLSWKFSDDQNISIVLTFQYNGNGSRTLINGDIYKGDNNYKIKEIKMHDELKVDDITYENVVMCIFD
jgi:hypothetical protein